MEYETDARAFNFVSGLLLGAAIGAGIALMTAPQSGRRTRRKLRRAAGDLRIGAEDRWDDLADEVRDRVDEAIAGSRRKLA